MAGTIVSFVFWPREDALDVPSITVVLGLPLLLLEYLFTREIVLRKKRPITASWATITIIALCFGLIPEGVIILVTSFLWPIVLPLLGIYIFVLAYILLTRNKRRAH